MRTLMSALFTTGILTGIALGPVHATNFGSLDTTNLICAARIDSTPDMGFTAPGPTDPNGPST